jgi:Fic-DOC domain mobile mystery protein B
MPDMLSREFIELLHRRMYSDVWAWAGEQRTVDTNIGVSYPTIGTSLKALFDDARYWLEHNTYPPVEFAARMHHRLVFIHPFANGNGRHARFYADLILTHHFQLPPLTWGGGQLGNEDPRRAKYIATLQAADNHDYQPLFDFVTTE